MLPVDVVKKVLESIETGDMETTGIYLSDSLVCAGLAPENLNKEQYLKLMSALLDAIPNWMFNFRDMQEKGNTARVKVRITGTNTGVLNMPFMGIAQRRPTGIRVTLPEERIDYLVKDNKIHAIRSDQASGGGITGIFRQLGIQMPEKVAV